MQPKHILVATDLNEENHSALISVAQLAERTGARVTLLHVVYNMSPMPEGALLGTPIGLPNYELDRKAAEGALADKRALLPPNLEVQMRAVMGTSVASTIVQEAADLEADLVVIHTHGRTRLRRFFLGSVAEEVLRRSPIPVLCFPRQKDSSASEPYGPLQHLLLSTDLSKAAMLPFKSALRLAKALECRVTVLHVVPKYFKLPYVSAMAPPVATLDLPQEMLQARRAMERQCSRLLEGLQSEIQVVCHEDPALGIVEFASRNDVDLLAISTHGRSGFRHLVLGSVAEEVLRRSSVPVLSFQRSSQ